MIGDTPLMLDELLDDPLAAREVESFSDGVPATQVGDAPLLLIPRPYVIREFEAAMDKAEEWAEENFGASEVNLVKMGGTVLFAPSPRTPLRHQ
jgi:hypothetical protein